jgi:hypothetical protein
MTGGIPVISEVEGHSGHSEAYSKPRSQRPIVGVPSILQLIRAIGIWVSGKLLAESKSERIRYMDGEAIVEMSYVMNADMVEPY